MMGLGVGWGDRRKRGEFTEMLLPQFLTSSSCSSEQWGPLHPSLDSCELSKLAAASLLWSHPMWASAAFE